jgi:hypothetical protein
MAIMITYHYMQALYMELHGIYHHYIQLHEGKDHVIKSYYMQLYGCNSIFMHSTTCN